MIQLVGVGYDSSPKWSGRGESCYLGGVRVRYGEAGFEPHLQIHTDESASEVSAIRVSVQWRGIPKGVTGSYGDLSDVIWSRYESPSTELTHSLSTPYSGTDWAVGFSDIGEYKGGGDVLMDSGTNLLDEIMPKGTGFASRSYDSVGLFWVVAAEYADGRESRAVIQEQWVTYFPQYTLSSLTIKDEYLVVGYLAGGWDRTDDRWAIEELWQDGVDIARDTLVGNVTFGTIDAEGRISIPLAAFRRTPKSGEATIRIRMNASFRDEGQDWGYIDGTADVSNSADCNSMALTLGQVTQDRIIVLATDLKDRQNSLVSVWAQVVGYDMTATASFQSGPTPTATITFQNPPLGVPLTIEGIGSDGDGDTSDSVWLTVPAIADESGAPTCATITPVSGRDGVTLRFNGSADWTYEPTYEVVKFSGRFRESVAYGIGGPITGTLSCDILSDEAYGDLRQAREDFENLCYEGVCIYRDPDGMRRRVMVESVSESWDKVRFVRTMKIKVREVE